MAVLLATAAIVLAGLFGLLGGSTPAADAQGENQGEATFCVFKTVGQNATDAGFGLADVSLSLAVDGAPVATTVFTPIANNTNEACSTELIVDGVASFSVPIDLNAPSAQVVAITEVIAPGAAFGSTGSACDGQGSFDLPSATWTVTVDSDETRRCTFFNDSIPVCINKIVGFDPEQLGIDLDSDPAPWTFDVLSQMAPVPVVEVASCEGPGFFVKPGAPFMISETINPAIAEQVAMTEAFCVVRPPEGNSEFFEADEFGVVTATAPTSNQISTTCTLVNESNSVCIVKELGAQADAAGASIVDVAFSLNESTPQSPERSCSRSSPAVQYFVAPGTTFTLSEQLPTNSPARPVSIECEQFVQAQESRFDVGSANLAAGSITIDAADNAVGPIDCVFTNDAVIVCVVKDIDFDLEIQNITASSFTFQLTASGQPSMELQPGPATDMCPNNNLGEGQAVAGVALAPGTVFSLSEDDPGLTTGLVSAECRRGIEGPLLAELDESTLASRTLENIVASVGENRIECRFDNESVQVCVTKEIGLDAAGAGFTNTGTFTATVNGEPTGQTLTPETPDGDNPCDASADYFSFYAAPFSTITLTETLPSGSPLGLVSAACDSISEGPSPIATSLTGQTVSFDAASDQVSCTLVNDMRVVCVTKTVLAGAQAAGYAASDFGFTVTFDGEAAPEVPESCQNEVADNQAVTGFAYRPGSTQVTVQEVNTSTNPLPYGLESAQCVAGEAAPVVNAAGTDSVTFADADVPTECEFRNDTLIVCVTKEVGATAVAAGFGAADFDFTLVDGDQTVESFSTECAAKPSDTTASYAYALTPDSAGTFTVTETPTAADARVGLVSANCVVGLSESTTDLQARTVVAPKDHGGDSVVQCQFINDSVAVTIAKTLITDNGVVASASDFFFDVFDDQGGALETGLSADAVFYVVPGSTFVISERAVPGFTTTASCSDVDVAAEQALPTAASVTHTPGAFIADVVCTFVNDDVPPIPVCAMLFLDEGVSDFTLADFTFELFLNGAIVGSASADGAASEACEAATESSAAILPSNLLSIAEVFADGSTYSIMVSAQDPNNVLEFDSPSCSVDAPVATQALRSSEVAMFTAEVGVRQVLCVARVAARAPEVVGRLVLPRPDSPVVEEAPVVVAAAAPAAAAPTQVVSSTIAVTGTSTTGVTLPAGLALFAAGFLVLGFERRDRARRRG